MNDEKLIELVRQITALYDFENIVTITFKDKIWSTIAKYLNVELENYKII